MPVLRAAALALALVLSASTAGGALADAGPGAAVDADAPHLRWLRTGGSASVHGLLGAGVATGEGALDPATGEVRVAERWRCAGRGPVGVDVIGTPADGEEAGEPILGPLALHAVDERTGERTGLVVGGIATSGTGASGTTCHVAGGVGDIVLVDASVSNSASLQPSRSTRVYRVAEGEAALLHAVGQTSCASSSVVLNSQEPRISGAYLVGAGSTCVQRSLEARDLRTGGLVASSPIGEARVVALDAGPQPGTPLELAAALTHDGEQVQRHDLVLDGGGATWAAQRSRPGRLLAAGPTAVAIAPPGGDGVDLVRPDLDPDTARRVDTGVPAGAFAQHVLDDAGRLLVVAGDPRAVSAFDSDGARLWTADLGALLGAPVQDARIDAVGPDGGIYLAGRIQGDTSTPFIARIDGGGAVEPPGVLRVQAGADPVDTAVELCRRVAPVPGSAARVVLARSDVFADALAASALAGPDGCVLFQPDGGGGADRRSLLEAVRALPPGGRVYIAGGVAAVGVEVAVDYTGTGFDVVRLAGDERTATAAAIAREIAATRPPAQPGTAFLATAAAFPDAVTAGALAARTGTPLLLTDPTSLSPAAASALADLGITRTVVLGGAAAVSDAVLAAVPGGERVAGTTRYGTAAAIALELWDPAAVAGAQVVAIDGERSWQAALAAGPLAAAAGTPQIGVAATTLPEDAAAALADLRARGPLPLTAVGASASLAPAVLAGAAAAGG